MASFGLSVVNDSGAVIIDSEYSRLCILDSGRYTANSEGANGLPAATIVFSTPIKSQEPPLLFVRPDVVTSVVVPVGSGFLGSPGNWTGLIVSGLTYYSPSGKYFIAAFSSAPVATFGMRLFNSAGTVVFDSGTPAALFTRVVQNWTYVKSTIDAQGMYTNWYTVPFSFSESEYIMINNASMRMISSDNIGRTPRIYFDFKASQLWFTTTALGNPYAFNLPAMFAKIAS